MHSIRPRWGDWFDEQLRTWPNETVLVVGVSCEEVGVALRVQEGRLDVEVGLEIFAPLNRRSRNWLVEHRDSIFRLVEIDLV